MKSNIISLLLLSLCISKCATSTNAEHFTQQYQWLIHSNGVGGIQLQKPIPAKILNNIPDLKRQYFYTYIADGMLFEGFKINDPHLLVGINNGPFGILEEKHETENPAIDLDMEAVSAVKKGAIVKMLIINSKKYTTQKNIGVGSTYNQLKKSYPDLKKNKVPPTMGEDLCSSYTKELKNVYFYFKNCKDAENNGKVIRIMIFN